MNTLKRCLLPIGAALIFFTSASIAQPESKSLGDADLIGVWLVSIEGEANTRTLIVPEAPTARSGVLPGAKYGLSGGNLPPVDAKLSRLDNTSNTRQLSITTLASSVIAALEQTDGSYKGTFTFKNGTVRPAHLTRVADGSLPQALPRKQAKDLTAPIQPGAGVPSECAALHGNWAGNWSQGASSEQHLRIAEVSVADGKCQLRFSYSGSKTPIPATLTADVTGGSFSFICNRSTSGTCQMKIVGGDIWASYANPAGGTNNAVFRRAN